MRKINAPRFAILDTSPAAPCKGQNIRHEKIYTVLEISFAYLIARKFFIWRKINVALAID
jgi:hypothetical protein